MTRFNHDTAGAEVVETFRDRVKGKTILITGPSDGGLGAEAARTLAIASPKLIVLAGRSIAKIEPVIGRIESAHPDVATKHVPLDLGSQASVREAAGSINASVEKIDIVINNAAIMACPFAKTVDGIESQFGTNYVGHFLLTNLLMEKILAAGSGSRIVNVSSSGHRMADVRLDDWNFENGALYHPWKAYGQAKTATILFTVALASKLKSRNIHAFSLHPGSIRTGLQKHIDAERAQEGMELIISNTNRPFSPGERKTLQQGCSTVLVAALDPSIQDLSGAYLEDGDVARPEDYAVDPEKAESLWSLSERIVGQRFTYWL